LLFKFVRGLSRRYQLHGRWQAWIRKRVG
jgi:hypothetical protein